MPDNITYNIEIPFTERELQELLYHEDKSFSWVFSATEDENVSVNVNIVKEEME